MVSTVSGPISFALDGTKGIIDRLEANFGEPFPYPKLDQITAPVMPGAMENAGADLYQDNLLILDDAATTAQKRAFGMVVAHELAHQWFGDAVTEREWGHLWLSEGFATYFSALKLIWLFENIPGARARAARRETAPGSVRLKPRPAHRGRS